MLSRFPSSFPLPVSFSSPFCFLPAFLLLTRPFFFFAECHSAVSLKAVSVVFPFLSLRMERASVYIYAGCYPASLPPFPFQSLSVLLSVLVFSPLSSSSPVPSSFSPNVIRLSPLKPFLWYSPSSPFVWRGLC